MVRNGMRVASICWSQWDPKTAASYLQWRVFFGAVWWVSRRILSTARSPKWTAGSPVTIQWQPMLIHFDESWCTPSILKSRQRNRAFEKFYWANLAVLLEFQCAGLAQRTHLTGRLLLIVRSRRGLWRSGLWSVLLAYLWLLDDACTLGFFPILRSLRPTIQWKESEWEIFLESEALSKVLHFSMQSMYFLCTLAMSPLDEISMLKSDSKTIQSGWTGLAMFSLHANGCPHARSVSRTFWWWFDSVLEWALCFVRPFQTTSSDAVDYSHRSRCWKGLQPLGLCWDIDLEVQDFPVPKYNDFCSGALRQYKAAAEEASSADSELEHRRALLSLPPNRPKTKEPKYHGKSRGFYHNSFYCEILQALGISGLQCRRFLGCLTKWDGGLFGCKMEWSRKILKARGHLFNTPKLRDAVYWCLLICWFVGLCCLVFSTASQGGHPQDGASKGWSLQAFASDAHWLYCQGVTPWPTCSKASSAIVLLSHIFSVRAQSTAWKRCLGGNVSGCKENLGPRFQNKLICVISWSSSFFWYSKYLTDIYWFYMILYYIYI